MHRTCIDRGVIEYERIHCKRPYSAHVVPDRTAAGARVVYSNSLSQSQRADHPSLGSRRWRQPSLQLYLSTYFTFLASL